MRKMVFTKMVGAGNDFVLVDFKGAGQGLGVNGALARRLCERKTGIGADGVLFLEKSKAVDFKMRVFNADGSEAEMCGNGLRCAVLFKGIKGKAKVETMAGIYEGEITSKNRVKVKMEEPAGLRLNFPIDINGRDIKANFINTGVPHTVILVEGLDKIDLISLGSQIRHHDEFKPKGTNVNFVEVLDGNNIKIRTYERGVEGETLACGTGSVASAVVSAFSCQLEAVSLKLKINVHTRGGILKVEFQKIVNKIKNVYLEGEAKKVFTGEITL